MKLFFHPLVIIILSSFSLLNGNQIFAQTTSAKKMAQLSFMVGDWEGISKSFQEDGTKEVMAHELVQYKVDGHLITIDLESESLKLHTVIYYDEKDKTYYYCPFYKSGSGKYKGELENGAFRVWFSKERRLLFTKTSEGAFHEYGERLQEGNWVTYFEDILPLKN